MADNFVIELPTARDSFKAGIFCQLLDRRGAGLDVGREGNDIAFTTADAVGSNAHVPTTYLRGDHFLEQIFLVEEHKHGRLLEDRIARHLGEQVKRFLHPIYGVILVQNLEKTHMDEAMEMRFRVSANVFCSKCIGRAIIQGTADCLTPMFLRFRMHRIHFFPFVKCALKKLT